MARFPQRRRTHENVNCSLPLLVVSIVLRYHVSCWNTTSKLHDNNTKCWRNQITCFDYCVWRNANLRNFCGARRKLQRTWKKAANQCRTLAAKRSKTHCAQYQSPFYRYTRETRNLNLFMSLAINFTTLTRRILMQLEVWYDAMEKRVFCYIGDVWSNFPSRLALSSLSKPQHTDSCHFFSVPRILPSMCGDRERK